MASTIVRRFEVPVATAEVLSSVAAAIGQAVDGPIPGEVRRTVATITRPPLVEVRLEGELAAVSRAMARVSNVPRVRIRHDVIRVKKDGRKGPDYPDLLARVRIGAEAVPPVQDGADVTVAIVDSGLMVEHPVFADHLWTGQGAVPGRQFIGGRPPDDIADQDGHGTLVAGTVLAAAVGAPVKLLAAKFFDTAHPARPENAAAALRFAAANARIMVLAWDVGIGSLDLEGAFREACQRALVVIAAGNYGSDNDWYGRSTFARAPARYTKDNVAHTITVMALDESEKAWFSNYGRTSVDLAAPGVGIASTRRSVVRTAGAVPTGFRTHGGTSAAAAHVAGAAALLMSRYPALNVPQIKRCLVESVTTVPGLKCVSGGRLNVGAALARAAEEAKKR